MDVLREVEFISKLNLKDCVRHPKGFNFKHQCPTGLDKKRRGYILVDREKITAYCHHCSLSTNLKTFIQNSNVMVYDEYLALEKEEYLEKLKSGQIFSKRELYKPHLIKLEDNELSLFKLNEKYFVPANKVQKCIDYCAIRKFPEGVIDKLKYCTHPTKIWGDMLIFPLYWKDDEHVYGFQGRSMDQKMFYNFSKNESFKVHGIFHINKDKPVYIFESIIDSFYKPNSIAVLGSDISLPVLGMIKEPIFVFDNDIHKDRKGLLQSIKYAEQGHKVMVWPTELNWAKDLNDLAKAGWSPTQISLMVDNNIYSYLGAVSRIKMKMRGKR
jgi:hypothetical protein